METQKEQDIKVETKPEEKKKATKKASILRNTSGKEVKEEDIKVETKPEEKKKATKKASILRNTSGKEVKEEDYFFEATVPSGFSTTCGNPVDREDLVAVFNKVFSPKDDILFYKQADKEVYIIIPPIRFSTTIGEFNNSIKGDFQKHAISFLNEGSVNLDSLKMKLQRIQKFLKYTDR